jgi:hypothetical protein
MQDEIVSRLANTLNAQLIATEAQRAERSPHPDSMDLYFLGKVLLNKSWTSDGLAQARGFFERALQRVSTGVNRDSQVAPAERV